MKQPIWTGLDGEADETVRNIGVAYWVIELTPGKFAVTQNFNTFHKLTEQGEWLCWLLMMAQSVEQAMVHFHDARAQWEAWMNGVEDWRGVVSIKNEDERPESGPIDRLKATYKHWVVEYYKRYHYIVDADIIG